MLEKKHIVKLLFVMSLAYLYVSAADLLQEYASHGIGEERVEINSSLNRKGINSPPILPRGLGFSNFTIMVDGYHLAILLFE